MSGGPDLLEKAHRRAPGPRALRRIHQERAERRRRRRKLILLVAGLAVLVAIATQVRWPVSLPTPDGGNKPERVLPTQETRLFIGTLESDPSSEASWLAVYSWDRKAKRGFIMYIPRTTLVEIPGYGGGPESASKAYSLGKEPLQASAISNLLGINFTSTVRVSDQATIAWFDKVGGVDIEVKTKITRTDPDGKVRAVFSEGPQHLDGRRAAEYLAFTETPADELARGARHAEVWGALFGKFRVEGGQATLQKLATESKDLFVTEGDSGTIAPFLSAFSSMDATDVIFETLPAQAQGVDTGTQFYKPQMDSIQQLVGRYLSRSRTAGAGKPGRRVQILNGNGKPGIGQEVGKRLIPKGFRVVLDANAKNFDYKTTQIVVYSDSRQAETIAREIREALGAGEILISRQRQTVVDVTVVVGKDYG